MSKLIYVPTDEEKQELNKVANEVIDLITERCETNIGKIGFVMEVLYKGFKASIGK